MYKIIHLPHTADIRLKIEADSLEALFRGGVAAVNDILKPGFCNGNGHDITRVIETRAVDTTVLFIDFLSDLLTLSYAENVIFCEMALDELSEQSVKATVRGGKAPFFEEDIKAVTYHEAEVRKNEAGRYETLVIFDI